MSVRDGIEAQETTIPTPAGAGTRISLASEPPLRLGPLAIEPSLRRIAHNDGREQFLEPRVMQVFVALVRAAGGIVTRNDLLAACWNGVIVGEDAIDRVIGRLRRVGEGLGGFRIETVTKVGYRLVESQAGLASEGGISPEPRKPSVCVLPFVNMSDDPQQAYFSDGITEDIITDLSKVSSLSVLARTTSFSVRDLSLAVPELAARLEASHVVEGSVRKADGRIRVSAQLIDGRTGAHLWADRYDRPLSDLFALQDDLTAAIVGALRLQLLPEERDAIEQRGTHDPDAYELYLLARRYYLADEDAAGQLQQMEAIERLCGRAVSLDPNFARAWSLLAASQVVLCYVHNQVGDGGRNAIERALSLDPTLAEAHATKARQLVRAGELDAAEVALEEALRLDAKSGAVHASAARLAYARRDFVRAVEHFERAAALGHDWPIDSGMLLSSYHAVGDEAGMHAAAARVLARVEQTLARDQVNLGSIGCAVGALIALGDAGRAKALIDRSLLIDPDNLMMRYNFACGMSAFLGDADAAIELLRPAFKQMSPGWLRHASSDPDLDPIRSDPRFEALFAEAARRLGENPRDG